MALQPGTTLGPYEIHSPLGAGGMGEVYRARDTRLERTVAIKILPAHLSSDPIRKQRFEREAKTISSLNHPHICVLHDIGSQDGVDYLVMECVEGETLARRLEKGALPLEQVSKYGAQIADALDKAHCSGVVHRDLKPGNIMLTATGAKLLDFGLAMPAAPLTGVTTMTAAVTKDSPLTEQGTIAGTFQYMSPEQIGGKELDRRSDIFSLGAVLYEMLTGRRAFEGKSQLSVASAILEKEPAPISAIKPLTPPVLDHAVKKCLAKMPDERWQSASDLADELKWISEGRDIGSMAALASAKKSHETLAWLVAGTLATLLLAGTIWWRNSKPPNQTQYFTAPMPFPARDIAVAPDGRNIALVAYVESARKNALWIYELGSPSARVLADTEGATYPFWSPDGRSVAFFADGKLKRLELLGGQVQTVCDAPSGRGGTWNKDGVILFAPNAALGEGLYRVSVSGGAVTSIDKPDLSRGEQSHRWPMFLSDGTHYLYMAASFSGQKGVDAIFIGSLGLSEKRFVVEASTNAVLAAPGYLLFYRDRNLLAQRFDEKSFALTGEPTTILTDIQIQSQVKRAVFGASDSGVLVAQTGGKVGLSQLVWFDRKGKDLGMVGKPDVYENVSLALNGKAVASDKTDVVSQDTDVWTYDLQSGSAKRLTFGPGFRTVPIWSPDAAQLVISSNRQPRFNLYLKDSSGAQEEKIAFPDDVDNFPSDWSRDGKYILYTRGNNDLWLLTTQDLNRRLFLKAPSVIRNGQFSPDGKWVAYASNESGRWEIYVTSFPNPRGKWQVSSGGGEQPRWRGDGRELFYLSSDGKMMATPVTTGANFDSGTAVVLFQATPRQPVPLFDRFAYDVQRDGQRFLINTPLAQAETQPMSIILNWATKLNK